MRGEGLLFEAEDGRSRFLVHVDLPPVVVGRRPPFGPHNVRVPSILVSRQHVRIAPGPGGYTVEDAGSSGGAYLDDERLAGPRAIGDGARLVLCGDTVYVARTFLGATLAEVRAGGARLDVPAGMKLARDVLRALRPLHATGEVHGELAPDRVLHDQQHDRWTLAIHGWTALDPGSPDDDPAWLAPEVFHEQRLEPASDVYALGLVVYDAMAGRPAWPVHDHQENRRAKLFGGAPDWVAELRWSTYLQNFFLGLLALPPRQRPDVHRAIEKVFELRPELSRP